jgi:quinol monooxygenase YgiN
MFVQVIQGKAKDAAGLRKQWDRWEHELKPKATGFLGSTGGVTTDGQFIVLARFESEEAARAHSDSPAQGEWWEETSQYLEDPLFHDCTNVELQHDGGSDKAGFVQVMQGKVTDIEKARELDQRTNEQMTDLRPDVLGGIVAWHPSGRFTNFIYFTSEAEARANEKKMESSPEFKKMMAEWQAISDGETEFLDLSEPWYSSP